MHCGGEVIFAGTSATGRTVYYGAPPETGLWKLSMPRVGHYISDRLKDRSFGTSVTEFIFGFEIAELEGWGPVFRKNRDYMSYRPRSKSFVSVGQLEWNDVKELSAAAQWQAFGNVLVAAVERITGAKRKPKDFDYAALALALRIIFISCDVSQVTETD